MHYRERERNRLNEVSNITENPGISQSDCFEENNTHEITCICFINILKTFTFLSLEVTMFESSIGKKNSHRKTIFPIKPILISLV